MSALKMVPNTVASGTFLSHQQGWQTHIARSLLTSSFWLIHRYLQKCIFRAGQEVFPELETLILLFIYFYCSYHYSYNIFFSVQKERKLGEKSLFMGFFKMYSRFSRMYLSVGKNIFSWELNVTLQFAMASVIIFIIISCLYFIFFLKSVKQLQSHEKIGKGYGK